MIKLLNSYNIHLSSPVSLIIEWNFDLSVDTIKALQNFKNQLLSQQKDIQFVTSSFKSMLVKYKNIDIDILEKQKQIEKQLEMFKAKNLEQSKIKVLRIPVCYDDFGEDLNTISKQTGLSKSEIIHIHSEPIYTLYFIGFLPGFLYLGDVDKRIQMPRHKTPRQKVEKGSVGIAKNQTGVYPMSSPGGWQIIGKTPLDLFDVYQKPPSPFRPGDQIQFYPINRVEFKDIKNSKKPIEKLTIND